jgi:hypothetical protein
VGSLKNVENVIAACVLPRLMPKHFYALKNPVRRGKKYKMRNKERDSYESLYSITAVDTLLLLLLILSRASFSYPRTDLPDFKNGVNENFSTKIMPWKPGLCTI